MTILDAAKANGWTLAEQQKADHAVRSLMVLGVDRSEAISRITAQMQAKAAARAALMEGTDALAAAKRMEMAGTISHSALRAAGEAVLMLQNDALVAAGKKPRTITAAAISSVIR